MSAPLSWTGPLKMMRVASLAPVRSNSRARPCAASDRSVRVAVWSALALVPVFFLEMVELVGARALVNYGANKVRWPVPVPIPSRVRMHGKVSEVRALEQGFDLVLQAKIEVEGKARPAMAAEVLYRYYL